MILSTLNNKEWYFKEVPLNVPNANIAVFGDSMFKYYTTVIDQTSSWNSLLGGTNITDLSLTGGRIRNMYDYGNPTLLEQLITLNPDFCYVSIGTNNRLDSDLVVRNEYITLGQAIEAAGIPFVFSIIFPCTYGYTVQYNNGFNTRVPEIIDILIEVCEEYNWEYIDMRKQLIYKRAEDGLIYVRDDYSIDGIHLNDKGYREWSKFITRDINKRI